jgi:hypothetical protein
VTPPGVASNIPHWPSPVPPTGWSDKEPGLAARLLRVSLEHRRYDAGMDLPPPDPKKLLAHWMEWEKGEATPGRVMSNLKTGGMRELLEQLAGDAP